MPPRRSGRRTDYQWFNFGDVELAQGVGGNGTFGTQSSLAGDPGTIVRTRGIVGVTLDTAAVDESAIILFGLYILNSDAFVAGSAPELFSAGAADDASWLWQGQLYVSSGAEAAVITDNLVATVEIDSKAMRKLKANQAVVFAFQSPAALATDQGGTFDLSYYVHFLFGT